MTGAKYHDVVTIEEGTDIGTWHVCCHCDGCWRPNAAPEHYEGCPVQEVLRLRDVFSRNFALFKNKLRQARQAAETQMQSCWIWEGNEDLSSFAEEAVIVMYAGQLRAMLARSDPRQEAYDQVQALAREQPKGSRS